MWREIWRREFPEFPSLHSHPGPALCAQCLLCGEPEEYVCVSGASNEGCVLSSVRGPCQGRLQYGSWMLQEEVWPKTLLLFPRLLETSCSERPWDGDALPPSLALSRSQEPICSEEASARTLFPPRCPVLPQTLLLELGPDQSFATGSSFSPGLGFQPQCRCCSSRGPSGQTHPAAGAWCRAGR